MRTVFADAFYWIALGNPKDDWHERANVLRRELAGARVVTTDEVLGEVLNFFARYGAYWRKTAVEMVREIMASRTVEVVPQTRQSFEWGLQRYGRRLDKEYSLVDCVSMETMNRQSLREVLTHDPHFGQEGFTLLLSA